MILTDVSADLFFTMQAILRTSLDHRQAILDALDDERRSMCSGAGRGAAKQDYRGSASRWRTRQAHGEAGSLAGRIHPDRAMMGAGDTAADIEAQTHACSRPAPVRDIRACQWIEQRGERLLRDRVAFIGNNKRHFSIVTAGLHDDRPRSSLCENTLVA
jgi:hypothetical protein